MKRTRPQDWSEAELKRLKGMARRKVDARQIALALGRHVGSVKEKLREIGKVPRKRSSGCSACGKRGADVRPDFNWYKKLVSAMGFR